MDKNIYLSRKYHEKEKKYIYIYFGLTSAPFIALTLTGSKKEN